MSNVLLLLAAILAPPVGIVMLWMRRGPGVLKKILGSLAIAAWCVAALVLFFGLHLELDGSGVRPMVKMQRIEAHYAELEQSRAQPVAAAVTARAHREEHRQRLLDRFSRTEAGRPLPGNAHRDPGRREANLEAADRRRLRLVRGGAGRAFTIEQRRRQEVATAYDLATGRELWAHGWDAEFREAMGGDGPRACPTWHDGKVYALGAAGELRCLDARSGKRIWSRNILSDNDAENLPWGMAAAPLIVDDKVIVLPGGPAGKSVAAYNRLNGEPVWKALDDKASYTSPMLVTLAGKRQLLIVTAKRMIGLTVENGRLLWEYPWTTEYDVNAAQPLVIGDNRVFISAGYGHGAAVVELTPAEKTFECARSGRTIA